MAEPDPNTDPTKQDEPTPEGAAPEGASPSEGDGAEAPETPEESAAETSEEAGAEASAEAGDGERTAAEDLAAEALRAAQEAVSGINSGEADGEGDAGGDATDAASADADAAMAAMLQQQAGGAEGGGRGDARPVDMPAFAAAGLSGAPEGIDLLSDVNLDVKIELGRTRMFVEDVLKLSEGAVVELDKLAGDPVDVYVNQRLIARGEVLILNDNFCVRINEIVPSQHEAAAG